MKILYNAPVAPLCVFIPGGMRWYLDKYAQVQQQTNFSKIILYVWIFSDFIFQPGGYTVGYGLGNPGKALTVDCINSFSMKKPCQRFRRDNSTATFCAQNS